MSPLCRSLLLAPLLALVVLPARAVTIENLHTADVEVPDKSAQARSEAFRTGLERVLVKVSGTAAVLDRPGVSKLLEAPDALVQQYRYEPLETDTPDGDEGGGNAAEGDDAGPRFRLVATFAGGRIERRLEALDVVVWGRQRPEVLVWLAVDDAGDRGVLAADARSRAHAALMEAAERRALPVLLPLMDARDRGRIEFVDISGGFYDTVRAASERYRGDILLAGHVRRAGGTWRADWTLLGLGDRRAWTATARAIDAAVASGVDGATERLASTLAGKGGERRQVRARVQGVESLAAYARVSEYFDGLVRVESARLYRAAPGALVFDLAIQGRIDEFERAVALGDTLVRSATADTGRNGEPESAGDGGDASDGAGEAGAATTTGLATAETEAGAADTDGGTGARPVTELVFRLAD